MLNFGPVIDAMNLLHGVAAVYTPKGGDPFEVSVIPGRQTRDAAPNRSNRVVKLAEDWLIPATAWQGGIEVALPEPRVGDRLTVYYYDRETVWEVRAEGQQPTWEWSDRHKRLRRVHLVEIE